MDLYTSLTRLKQELANGAPVAMTPVPLFAQQFIDPAFTIGLGALEEDPERGLRCPVRGCGAYHHGLQTHLTNAHQAIGGALAVRKALEIPPTAALESRQLRERREASGRIRVKREGGMAHKAAAGRASQQKASRKRPAPRGKLAGSRNLRDQCEAQLRAKLVALQVKIGRSPSIMDVIAEYGVALVEAVKRNYGSWDNGKAQLGFAHAGRPGRPVLPRETVLRGIRAFYDVHGRFPTRLEADNPSRAPLICSAPATLRAMGAKIWADAMHAAAVELELYRGEPTRRSAQA